MCSQEHGGSNRAFLHAGECVCVCMCRACLSFGLWNPGGCRCQIPLLFLGTLSAQLSRELGYVSVGKATLPVAFPDTPMHPASTTDPYPRSLLLFPATPDAVPPAPPCVPGPHCHPAGCGLSALAPTRVRPLWRREGPRRGRRPGRGCSRAILSSNGAAARGDCLLQAALGQAMRVSVPLTPTPETSHSCSFLI